MQKHIADKYVVGLYGNTMTTNPRALDIARDVLTHVTPAVRANILARGTEFQQVFGALVKKHPHLLTKVTGSGMIQVLSARAPPQTDGLCVVQLTESCILLVYCNAAVEYLVQTAKRCDRVFLRAISRLPTHSFFHFRPPILYVSLSRLTPSSSQAVHLQPTVAMFGGLDAATPSFLTRCRHAGLGTRMAHTQR